MQYQKNKTRSHVHKNKAKVTTPTMQNKKELIHAIQKKL